MADLATPLGLVGDVGGTNARFALAAQTEDGFRLTSAQTLHCRDYPSLEAAIAAYLAQHPEAGIPKSAAIAVAGPVVAGRIEFTNLSWAVSESGLRASIGCSVATLLNDYAAVALGLPVLTGADLHPLGGAADAPGTGTPVSADTGTLAVMGPGTGFGVAALVRDGRHEAVLTGEGGHIAFAPADPLEIEILKALTTRFGRVSIERLLSGPGLENLFAAMAAIEGTGQAALPAADITRQALAGEPFAKRVVEAFCAILGSAAGDYALCYGAQGGIFIAGGIVPRILPIIEASRFRQRFEAKGRFVDYLKRIPTDVILHPHVALLGGARYLSQTAR